MPSLLGFASLAGVAVDDSILLLAFVKLRAEEDPEIEAVAAARQASRDRFRPMLLTWAPPGRVPAADVTRSLPVYRSTPTIMDQ
jgi:multidrug efflux pump subunit AcrB